MGGDGKMEQPKETIKGTVEAVTYQNELNCYTVCTVKTDKDFVTVVGTLPFLHEGESAEFEGNYIVHPAYGVQFVATAFVHVAPQNAAAILRYLSSGVL